jgi:glutathione S-transferase
MIILHQFQISPYCDKIRRIMNYKEIDYQVQEVTMAKMGGIKKKNPAGKLPFIEHDGKVVCDSTDIAYYLEEKFPEKPILPEDNSDRALVHFFEDWADESLYFYEMYLRFTLPHNAEVTIPKLMHADSKVVKVMMKPVVPKMMKFVIGNQGVGKKSLENVLNDVRRHARAISDYLCGRDWLVGNSITLADIGVISQLSCINDTIEGRDILGEHKSVTNWMERTDKATIIT